MQDWSFAWLFMCVCLLKKIEAAHDRQVASGRVFSLRRRVGRFRERDKNVHRKLWLDKTSEQVSDEHVLFLAMGSHVCSGKMSWPDLR